MTLYAIVDLPHPHGLTAAQVTRAVLGERLFGGTRGASMVQLRCKGATTEERLEHLEAMAPLCQRAGVPLVVNDDFEAAMRGPASLAGVHLGQDDPGVTDVLGLRAAAASAGKIAITIGISTHDLDQLRQSGRQGPDYLTMGPIAPTTSKANPDPVLGLDVLLDACRLAAAPLVAIGGMNLERGRRAIEYGVSRVAVIGALVAPSEDETRARALALADAFDAAAAPLPLEEVAKLVPVYSLEQLDEIARWSDDVGLHVEMGLPARFRPTADEHGVRYRRCDVLDLLHALGKRSDETWTQWRGRTDDDDGVAPLVRLRR